jgi:hypothetical protein
MRTAVSSLIHNILKIGLGNNYVLHENVQWSVNVINARQGDTASVPCNSVQSTDTAYMEHVCTIVEFMFSILCARIAAKVEVSLENLFHICPEDVAKQKIVQSGLHKYLTVISTTGIGVSHPFLLISWCAGYGCVHLTRNWISRVLSSTSWWQCGQRLHDLVEIFWK